MKLDPDCIRDTLLFLEDNLKVDLNKRDFIPIELKDLQKYFEGTYTDEEVWYTVYNLWQIRFIEGYIAKAGSMKMFFCPIENITWSGHQFLNTIRPKSIWEATKDKAKQIGGMSVHSLSMISMTIMQGLSSNSDFIQSIVDKIK